jgi:acyl-CoA synthetase (AMP-forming)/AMP-acid ligase II
LTSYRGIQQCCVIVKNSFSNNKFLVAIYVSDEELDENEIKNYLKVKLPEYMLPSKLFRIGHMPLTINGKLDTNKLAEIDVFADLSKKKIDPRNQLDMNLLKI